MKQIVLALATTLATATTAQAYSKVDDTTPADGTTVATVEVIEPRFDDPMRVTAFALIRPGGDLDVIRKTGLDPVMEFRAMPSDNVLARTYTVQ